MTEEFELIDLRFRKGDKVVTIEHPVHGDIYNDHLDPNTLEVYWRGPEDKQEFLALFHEMGHREVYMTPGLAPPKEQSELIMIRLKTRRGKPLTSSEARLLIQDERDAWANALRRVRTMRQQGVDPLGGVPLAHIREVVDGYLGTYVRIVEKRIQD